MRFLCSKHINLIIFLFLPIVYPLLGKSQRNNIQPPDGLMCDLIAHSDYQSVGGYPVQPQWNIIAFEQSQGVRIGSKNPMFSWIMKDNKTDVLQTAYQVLVSDSLSVIKSDEGDMWNSGKQISNNSSAVIYKGKPLKPHKIYYWKVRVWDNDGEVSPYSSVSAFFTDSILKTYVTATYPLEKAVQYPKVLRRIGRVYLADFGKDAFGQLKLRLASNQANDTVTILLGEALDSDGLVNSSPGGYIRHSQYILPLQEGVHTYQLKIRTNERNTRKVSIKMPGYIGEVTPFRYCEIENYHHPLNSDDIIREAVNYPFDDDAASFHSSDSILNAVWKLCKYTLKATSFTGTFIDGDRERTPYEADAYINQLGYYFADREYSIARHSCEYLLTHATWPTEWVLMTVMIAWNDYLYTGNPGLIDRYYNLLKAKTLTALQDSSGFITTRTGLQTEQFLQSIHLPKGDSLRDIVDWPHKNAPGTNKTVRGATDGFVFTKYNAVVNAFYYKALEIMSKIAGVTGHQEDANKYKFQSGHLKKLYQQKFWDPIHKRYRDGVNTSHASLHANMFALNFGLVKEVYKKDVMSFIRSRGMACSVYGSQFLLDAVYSAGDANYGLSLLTSKGERSWYNMIRKGSTITMEAWDKEFKPNLDWNHAWASAPVNIILGKLMGIEPLKPGWALFSICPQPGKLKWADIKVPTIRGNIQMKFSNQKEVFKMTVIIPANSKAEVSLPLQDLEFKKVLMDGKQLSIIPENRRILIGKVGSGKHQFTIIY